MSYFIQLLIIFVLTISSVSVFAAEKIKYVGSSTVGVFMYDAAKVYTKCEFSIDTKPESGGGERQTLFGTTDIGGVAREVKPSLLKGDIKQFLIGKDAIGVWVNKDNPVQNLTFDQLVKIFTGKVTNWKEVGGKDSTINTYVVRAQSATNKVFKKVVLSGENYSGDYDIVRPDSKIIDKIASDPNGIGHLSFAIGNNHKLVSNVKKIKINGETPTVNNPAYPISRPLYLIIKGDLKGEVKSFIEWAISDAGQKIVKKNFIGAK